MDLKNILCTLLLVLATVSPAGSEEKNKKPIVLHCWRIEQQSSVFGDSIMYASPEAVKIVFKNGKWMNLAHAPGWELYVYNPREKVYWHTPLDQWKLKVGPLQAAVSAGPQTFVRSNRLAKIGGLWAVRLIPRGRRLVDEHSETSGYWVARDLQFPEAIYRIACGNAFLPNLHALPLQVGVKIGGMNMGVDTTSAGQVDLPAVFFNMPTGFRETKDPQEVMNTGIMDVVKDMTDL